MSDTSAVALSRIELVVLGCLSQSSPPADDEFGTRVRELCLRDASAERARETAMGTLEELRRRRFVDAHKKLTDDGARALRTACGLERRPSWSVFRQRYFPAIVLGVPPAPKPRGTKNKAPDTMVQEMASRLGVPHVASLNELCDALIADQLKMLPGRMTLAQIRAHVLALRVHMMARALPGDAATSAAAGTPSVTAGARSLPSASATVHDGPPGTARHDVSRPHVEPLSTVAGAGSAPQGPPSPTPDLLASVRETLPQIGAEGRYGSEKVFVSALWHGLAHRGRPADLSLDHFKRWLVTANRNRWLTLARADVVGAMDPKQVRESEIQDLGATFHFVLDPACNSAAQQGRSHVR